jgi:hypothetical protein
LGYQERRKERRDKADEAKGTLDGRAREIKEAAYAITELVNLATGYLFM